MLFAPGWQTLANKGALHITTKHKVSPEEAQYCVSV